ncbi:MAG TPA: protein kinase [Pyrinomonadaceae bacterium]|nr:protein kinase [Pyrinomonadaceae bacterium]
MSGQIIGKYKLVEKLGEGGMGEVYRGVNMMVEREVAIKFLRPELAGQPQVVERFRSEAVTLAKLNHPNIATLYDFDRQGDSFIMVLEFVRGVSLDTVIQQRGAIPVDQAVPIFCQVLDGIQHAHDFGVIHRDIKPANMMLTEKGTLKVLDFGIARILGTARMTRAGNIIGTIEYMSPEQVRGMETDERSDIYSLGMLLYEMLTGRCPFEIQNEFELMKAQIEQFPMPPRQLNPAIPEVVEQAIWRSIQKDPAQRFQNAAEFRTFLLTAGFAATGRIEPLAVGDPNPYATRPLNTQPPASNPNIGFATVPSQPGFQPTLPGTPSNPGAPAPSQQLYSTPSNPGVQQPPSHVSNPGADLNATLVDAPRPNSKETRVSTHTEFQPQPPQPQTDALKATRIGGPVAAPQQPQQLVQQYPVQQQQGFQPGPATPAQKKKGFGMVHFAIAGVAALFLLVVVAGGGLYFMYGRKAEPVKPSALNTPAEPQPTSTQAAEPAPQPSAESASQPKTQGGGDSTQSPAPPQTGGDSTQTPPSGYVPITPTEPAGGGDKQTAGGGTRVSTPAPRPAPTSAPKPPPQAKRCACGCACGDSRCLAKCALDN